jgi:hypothetical protein
MSQCFTEKRCRVIFFARYDAMRWGSCAIALVVLFAGATVVRAQAPAGVAQGGKASQPSQTNQPSQTAQPNQPSLMAPMKSQNASTAYSPITAKDRFRWVFTSTVGPGHVVGDLLDAAFDTGINSPKEYGPGFVGFGKRFGINVADSATQSTMEAGLGTIWGEDPRYFPEPEEPFGARVKNVIVRAFTTRRRDGNFDPAYARFIAIPGTNFLANTWWPTSQADTEHALLRTAEGFGTKMANNAWYEFWPGVKARLFHRGAQ